MNIENRTKLFLEKSKKIHNEKYDYSLVQYINAHTKVKIICKIHGIFEQKPDAHIRNHGCKLCNGGTKYNNKDFIEKAKLIHDDKYDYSLVEYNNNTTSVKIICKKHKFLFEQKPQNHMNGCGCPKCGLELLKFKKIDTKESFIKKSIKLHSYKYDYSDVVYRNSKTKVKINCLEHGSYEQIPNSHLSGAGCPFCKESKGETKIRVFLEKHLIEFKPQMRFENCKLERPLPFDFYLPQYNLCIEYDGIHHFKSVEKFGGKIGFKLRKETDLIKSEYCSKKENPNLIRISYKQFSKIETILSEFLLSTV